MSAPFTNTKSSATISTTEYGLFSASTTITYQTTAAKLSGWIDFSAMTAGDTYDVFIYEKVNGSAAKLAHSARLAGAQSELFPIPEIWVSEGYEITVKKIAGTDRSIGWSLNRDVGDTNLVTWLGTAPNVLVGNDVPANVKRWDGNALSTGPILATHFSTDSRRELKGALVSGVPTAIGATTVTLAVGSSAQDDFYNGAIITIYADYDETDQLLQGQTRTITDYVGSTRVVTVDTAWIDTTGFATLHYDIWPNGSGSGGPSAAVIADAVWDELRSGHTIAGSYGEGFDAIRFVRRATAQGGSARSITLDTSASATPQIYDGQDVYILSGTGAGQSRKIVNYTGSSKIANVDKPWATNPDNTSVFVLVADSSERTGWMHSGQAQTGAVGTITLDTGASATDDYYNETMIRIAAGTGAGQTRLVSDYVGVTRVASVIPNWITSPGNDSVFVVWGVGRASANVATIDALPGQAIADYVWDEATAGHVTAGTFGKLDADIYATIDTEIASIISSLTIIDDFLDTEISTLLTNVAAIKAITDLLTLPAIADAVHDEVVEGTHTFRQYARGYASALFGKVAYSGTSRVFRDVLDTKDRITATVDASGRVVSGLVLT